MRIPTAIVVSIMALIAVSGATASAAVAGPRRPSAGMQPAQLPPPSSGATASVRQQPPQMLSQFNLPAPAHLMSTLDYPQCSAHGGLGAGLACKASLPAGGMALIWDYPAKAAITGFHIYQATSLETLKLIGTQALGASTTIWVLNQAPSGGYFSGGCYLVTAFNDKGESPYSNAFCGENAQTMQTLSLTPTVRTSGLQNKTLDEAFSYNPQLPLVGYNYTTVKGHIALNDYYLNDVLRTGLFFDMSALANAHIVSARLRMEVDRTWTGKYQYPPSDSLGWGLPSSHSTSCTDKILMGGDRWMKNADWIEAGAQIAETGVVEGPDIKSRPPFAPGPPARKTAAWFSRARRKT
jgi:hypothetical protein